MQFSRIGLISGVIVRIDPEDLTITPVAKIGRSSLFRGVSF